MTREEKIFVSTAPIQSDELGDDEIRMQINLRVRLDDLAEAETRQLRASTQCVPSRQELCRLACRIYDSRRARDKIIDRKLFGEPVWDMLLALYCLPTRGEIMTVTSLSLAACVPQATGIRWQRRMTQEGLIERGPQGCDQRRHVLRLTEAGRSLMDRYLTHLFYCITPMPPHPERAGG